MVHQHVRASGADPGRPTRPRTVRGLEMDSTDHSVLAILSGDASATHLPAVKRRRSVLVVAGASAAAMIALALHDELPGLTPKSAAHGQVSITPLARPSGAHDAFLTPRLDATAEPPPHSQAAPTPSSALQAAAVAPARRRAPKHRSPKNTSVQPEQAPAPRLDLGRASPADRTHQIRDEQLEAMDAIRQLRQR